jgi:hypothetical protein
MKKPTKKGAFQMSALLGSLAAGYVAAKTIPPSDDVVAERFFQRVGDEEFRNKVLGGAPMIRASAPAQTESPAPVPEPIQNAPLWWRPLPDDAHLCPVTGVEGLRLGGDGDRIGPPWEHDYQWIHPTDPTIRWAHFTGEPKNADPRRNGIFNIPGPGMRFVAFPYREVWEGGVWNPAVDPEHFRRPLTSEDRENLGFAP